jgi:hypothetical protein
MLLKLSDPVGECLRRAEECRRRARISPDAPSIMNYLRMEQRWLFLARSREFEERLSRFIGSREVDHHSPASRSRILAVL